MLNIDKYREEILEAIKEQKRITDINDPFYDHKIYFPSLKKVVKKHGGEFPNLFSGHVKWLLSEYEPPLLENGDGLKPGEYIMVKNYKADTWVKRCFIAYYNGWFLTADDMGQAIIYKSHGVYTMARLPMEDELDDEF